jgi:hypothetical protein
MKNLLSTIYEIFESIGKARAAAELSRNGLYEEAKQLMLSK